MTGATGNIYAGLHEFNDMAFLLHLLREGDHFVDVGANIGSYTILASKVRKAFSISFEPVPSTFYWLKLNIAANEIEGLVDARNIGCSGEPGILRFSKNEDTTNHVLVDGENVESIAVYTLPMDEALKRTPIMIKIDAEGFETEVLRGSQGLLKKPGLKAILIELNGSGLRYGFDEKNIHEKLINHGFKPYTYEAFSRSLQELQTYGKHNTIYIRDFEAVQERVTSSEPFPLWGEEI